MRFQAKVGRVKHSKEIFPTPHSPPLSLSLSASSGVEGEGGRGCYFCGKTLTRRFAPPPPAPPPVFFPLPMIGELKEEGEGAAAPEVAVAAAAVISVSSAPIMRSTSSW
jgi:hypothetical protein